MYCSLVLQHITSALLLLPPWLDPQAIINNAGPWALAIVALIVFAECGVFSLLPGDSLLFTVGMLAATPLIGTVPPIHFAGTPWATLIASCAILTVAAILGNVVGYHLGRIIGPPIFKPRSGFLGKVFDPQHVERTNRFFDQYGPRALIIARFIPMVRTFITLIAGAGRMDQRRFLTYTAIGGVLWVALVTTLGFFLGRVPFVQNNLEVMLLAIVAVSLIPMVVEIIRGRSTRAAA